MSSVKVESVVKEHAQIGEGPVWEESEQTLLFIDITGQKIHRWNAATNQIQSLQTADTVGFAVPRRSGGYVAGVGCSIVAVDWSTQKVTSLASVEDDKPENRLNDGKADPMGRLLAGTAHLRDAQTAQVKPGSLYLMKSDLSVTKLLGQVDISNGMDWTADLKTLFYIDSLAMSVDAFDYNSASGNLGNRRVVYRLEEGEGVPDGMTLDANDRLWVACYNGGRVLNIDPATGKRLQTVSLPATKTTSCCFGGPDYSDLYVTSASLGLDQSELQRQPAAGNTFRVTGLGVKGRPSNAFNG
uniref:Regucalcin n=1 Tax=Xiphophorus couchianus TaxID=32473 RepID=A0A3B5MRJ3_9TELE